MTKKNVDNVEFRSRKYLVEARARLMFAAAAEGYNFSDIAMMFRIDKSIVSRLFSERMEEYKAFIAARA